MPLPTLLIKGKLHPPSPETDSWVPVEYIINWFKERQYKTGVENRVLVLLSETASGKSTMFPPELYRAMIYGTSVQQSIICTQPRVLTAIENVYEMLKWYSKILRLGETIGWSTKANKMNMRGVGLLSATVGTLAQQLRTLTDDEIMQKYKYILIDETHERDLQTEITLFMLKSLLARCAHNPNCPFIVLMSATFDPDSFLKYFGVSKDTNFIWCKGETAGFDEMWDWNQGRTVNDFPRAAAQVCEKIIRENPDDDPATADILVFMPGQFEFSELAKRLRALNEQLVADAVPVFSLLLIDSTAVQSRNLDYLRTMYIPVGDHRVNIKGKIHTPSRRVIISTNVAETGLTLDNLKYVIDSGYNREIEYNPVHNITSLLTKPAPRSRIKQRRGRAGRKFRGVFYPLYPKYIYDKLAEIQLPQILTDDISPVFLDICANGHSTLNTNIDLIDPPSPDALGACLEKFYSLGFITHKEITPLGQAAKKLSGLAPETARAVLAAWYWKCSPLDMVSIAAYIGFDQGSFAANATLPINWAAVYTDGLPKWFASAALMKYRLLCADEFIHGIILVNAMKVHAAGPARFKAWCEKVNLSYRQCIEFIRARDDLIDQMLTAGFNLDNTSAYSVEHSTENDFMTTIAAIKHCIYDGWRGNLVVRGADDTYRTLKGLAVEVPKILKDNEKNSSVGIFDNTLPTYILTNGFSIKLKRKTEAYVVTAKLISVLDGFVSCDLRFCV